MNNNLLFVTNDKQEKIIVRLIRKGDKWGYNGQYIWNNEDDEEYFQEGVEFYFKIKNRDLIDNRQKYNRHLGKWLTRYYINDFFEDIEDDDTLILYDKNEEYKLTEQNVISIMKWLVDLGIIQIKNENII